MGFITNQGITKGRIYEIYHVKYLKSSKGYNKIQFRIYGFQENKQTQQLERKQVYFCYYLGNINLQNHMCVKIIDIYKVETVITDNGGRYTNIYLEIDVINKKKKEKEEDESESKFIPVDNAKIIDTDGNDIPF